MVDDGSRDATPRILHELAARHPTVRVFEQANAGKAAALNRGIAESSGEIVLLVDADGVFLADTVAELVRPFADPRVGAVCGDDRPVNTDRTLPRLLAVIGHVGTGLMRRAPTVLNCLPIVSGNSGAFRRAVLDEVGPLETACIGEDLELTWRVQRARHRVVFAPRAIVYAESPSTVRGLWRQRVRWARGLLQTMALRWRMLGDPRLGLFGPSLLLLAFSGVVLPLVQLAAIPLLAATAAAAQWQGPTDGLGLLLWIGLPLALALVVIAAALNGALRDLRYAPTLFLWPLYSLMMSATMVAAIGAEVAGRPRRWNKLERTGVRSALTEAG